MKIPIHKVLGRSSWALVAAGALGTTAPALGQSFPYLPTEGQAPASPSVVNEQHPEPAQRPAPAAPSPRGESPRPERHPNLGSQKTITPIVYPTKWRRAEDIRGAASPNNPTRETTPAQGREGLMWIDTQHEPAPLLELVPRPAPTSSDTPHSNGHATPVRPEVPAAGALPLGPTTSVLPAPAPEPDAYVTSGMLWLDAPEPPTRPVPLQDFASQASNESDAYVARGVMWLETSPAPTAPPEANKRPPEPSLLAAAKSPEENPAKLPELPKMPEQKRYQAPAPATQPVIGQTVKVDPEKVSDTASAPAKILPPDLPKAPSSAKTELPVTPRAPARIPPWSAEVRTPVQPPPIAVATSSPTISTPSTSSTMSPTPLYLPVESFKELHGNKRSSVSPASQANVLSANKTPAQRDITVLPSKPATPTLYSVVAPAAVVLEAPNSDSPLAPVLKLPEPASSQITNGVARTAEASLVTPRTDASVENGSVLLGPTTKQNSPYMPLGSSKAAAAKATAEARKSAAPITSASKTDKPAQTPVSKTEPPQPPATQVARVNIPAEASHGSVAPTSAVSSRKQASAPGSDAYVASGVVILDSTETAVERKPDPALLSLQTRLQKRMAQACGKPAKGIEVTAETPTKIRIRMKARTTPEAEEVSKKILQLPELVPIDVSLDVVIAP